MIARLSLGLAKELVTRTTTITAIYTIISYVILHKDATDQDKLGMLPLLFVTFGIVMLVNILFSLRKYNAIHVK